MGVKIKNNAFGVLLISINTSATSITLQTGQGANFPSLSAGDYFYATLIDTSNNLEIVKVTARTGDVLTIVRAQEGTTARSYAVGDRIELRLTAQNILDMLADGSLSGTGTIPFSALAATPVDKSGDTMTGQLKAPGFSNTFSTAVTDYRTQSPNSSSVLLVGCANDRDAWIYRDPAGGAVNWGVYHRNVDSTVASLPGNSIGFIGNDQLAAYIDLENKRIRSMTAVDQPYQMVVRTGGYTVPDGITDISYDVLVHSRYMSHTSGTLMYFDQPGKYLIITGWRFGAGSDVWTGVRLRDNDGTIRGLGFATGQVANDPGPCTIQFIADIPASRTGQAMSMQFIRAGSTMGVASPASSTYGYAIVTTVVQIGV